MNSYVESGTNPTWWQTVRCPGLRPGGSQTEKCHISVNFGFTKKNQAAELFQIMTSIQKCTKTSNIQNIMCTGFFLLQGGQNSPPPSVHFWLFWWKKKHQVLSSRHHHQNTSRINLFRFTNKEITPMTMVAMVALCPIWLLWLAKS
jgi:hypothetical protein